MQLSDRFLEDEVKDGFYVPGIMKSYWAGQLKVLSVVDEICKRHGLSYYADWGTLLGIIRHGGCIPWDDDFDIAMKREDMQQLIHYAKKELPEGYRVFNVQAEGKDKNDQFILRIVNNTRIDVSPERLNDFFNCPFIVGIDVFCLDFLPNDENEKNTVKTIIKMSSYIVELIKDYENNLSEATIESQELDNRRRMLNSLAVDVGKLVNYEINIEKDIREQLMSLLDYIFSMYRDNESKKIAFMVPWVETDGVYSFEKEVYSEKIEVKVKDIDFPMSVPIGYDRVLKELYGEYMRPVKAMAGHDYPIYYHRQVLPRIEHFKGWPFEYEYSQEILDKNEITVNRSLRQKVNELVNYLEYYNRHIYEAIKNNELEIELLIESQDKAIEIGNAIDSLIKDNSKAVRELEAYCETLYLISLGNMTEAEEIYSALTKIICNVKKSIIYDFKDKRKILFVPYKAEHWNAMDSIYRAAKADENNEVYVMPVPYYYKSPMGEKNTMVFEPHLYPKDIELIACNKIDFSTTHFDVIFIQNPYDQYNYSVEVHEAFYSKELKKHTRKLVYVPYFVTDDYKENDNIASAHFKYYMNLPGVLCADMVMLQSEEIKKRYLESLTEFTGLGEDALSKKMIVSGSPLMDVENKSKKKEDLPDCIWSVLERARTEKKKVVLIYNNISTLYLYKENAVSILRERLEYISKRNKDVIIWWKPDPAIQKNMHVLDKNVRDMYRKLYEEFIDVKINIYDDFEYEEFIVPYCDMYLGDAGVIAQQFSRNNKPTVIISYENARARRSVRI